MEYFTDTDMGLDIGLVNRAVESAFADHGKGDVQMPPKVYITLPDGDFRTMPAYLPSLGIAGVKIVNVHPDNPTQGLPTVMALTVILDIGTGEPTAVINATRLTDMRTGAAGAVACKYLSPKKEIVLGVIGTGRQAEAQVAAISRELKIRQIKIWGRNDGHVRKFTDRFMEFPCVAAPVEKACDCDVLVTTTPSRSPIVRDEWIHEGTHINAIGADAPGKEELDPAILRRAQVFVDDPAQAVHSGEINVPISTGVYREADIAGTLGEVVIGKKQRRDPSAITVFDSTGLAIQDLAIAKIAMQHGKRIELPFP
ncbi:MAG: ornithine cyclodeaminase family protein [Methanoregula sp.]|uniref:ornithine cyclodeaminase family protein n=1 Tax=Methanoregula sp. TaxID=2052170 RepID=UPI0025FAD1D5|nr:ornithine cyclodeaminase family protein [Methanoregula sp.]MCK9630786.1 ornithine cyclodeaminase family protein [Methanoregula sp.]